MASLDPSHVAGTGFSRLASLGQSFPDPGPIAEESIARDLEEASDDDGSDEDSLEDDPDLFTIWSGTSGQTNNMSYIGSYRRPSFTIAGTRGALLTHKRSHPDKLSKREREAALAEERSLLRDNHIIPPKHPQIAEEADSDTASQLSRHLRIPVHTDGIHKRPSFDEEAISPPVTNGGGPSETDPLLGDPQLPYGGLDPAMINTKWEAAVAAGRIQTTWQREAKVLASYSAPLMVTFLLQYSLTVASIFTLGHVGPSELGAVSIASMTANITGYAVYQGLATSLDTLCAQAYGSGKKKLVGLQMQRMIYFLWLLTIPIGIVWLLADKILMRIVPEPAVANLAGLYLKVVLAGAPAYACFEAGKRFVQAQGLFSAALYVLLFCAPLNVFLNWFFVWRLNMGFIGAPIAVLIVQNLLPILLFLYVYFIAGRGCWNGFTRHAFSNWMPMIKLAVPGLLMVEAEVLAFEILTFASSYFGVTVLAAQGVLATITNIAFQIPFTLSIASSTRIANLIGGTLADAAKITAKSGLYAAVFVGFFNFALLFALKDFIPRLFTNDETVMDIVSSVLPLCAAFQLFDALAANCNGMLRGLGRQEIGGYVQLFCYYVIAMPISLGTAFGLGWGVWGLWAGVALALGLVFVIEAVFLSKTSWERSVEEARQRNEGAL